MAELVDNFKGLISMHDANFVLVADLAKKAGMDRSNALKFAKKSGFSLMDARGPNTRGVKAKALNKEDADRFLKLRESYGLFGKHVAEPSDDIGVFYIIQLVPELNPMRVKFGFAGSIEQRIMQHRTAAPTCCVLAQWASKKAWEQTVIVMMTAEGCRLVMNEVYECDDLKSLVMRGTNIFHLLPHPTFSVSLSESSPFHKT